MAWKATVNSLLDQPVPTDSRSLVVTFERDNGSGQFIKTYKLTAGTFKTADDVRNFLADQIATLNEFDGVVADLTPLVGSEIAPGKNLPSRTDQVTMFQCRSVLSNMGLLDQVDAAVKAIGGEAEIAWEYAPTVSRRSPLVEALGAQLGLDSAQLDAMFDAASQITV